MSVKQRVVHDIIYVHLAPCIQEGGNGAVAFSVERREEVNQKSQNRTAQSNFRIEVLDSAKHLLKTVHCSRKIERNQTAKDAEQDGGGDTLNRERIDEIEGEHGLGTSQGIGEAGGGETGNEQRKQGGHCQVNHEHLKGENQTGNGGLENTGNGSRGSTADEEHQRLMV